MTEKHSHAGRSRVEQALRDSEARYRSIVKQSSDGIYILEPKTGVVLEANAQFLKMLGYTEEEVTHLTLRDIVAVHDDEVRTSIRRVLREGEDVIGLRQYRCKDGSLLDVEISASLVSYGDKQVVMVNVRDVTERRRVERALRESEDRYRTFFETTGCATIIIDEDMTVSLANGEFERLSGFGKAEIEGRGNWMDFIAPEDKARLAEYHQMRRSGSQAAPRNYEFKFIDRSGNVRPIFMTIALIPGTKRSVASLLDITDRKRMEEALRESERRYRTLFEESRDAIYLNRLDGRFVDVNQSMLDLLGYTKKEMLGFKASDLYVDASRREGFRREIEENGFVREYEIRLRKKDGSEIDCLVTSTFWRAHDGAVLGYNGIIHDITERKRGEEALRRAKDELELKVGERTAELQDANERLLRELDRRKRIEEMLSKAAERYKNLFENSPIGIYRTNPEGRILMANPTIVRMLGYDSLNEMIAAGEGGDYVPTYLGADVRERVRHGERMRNLVSAWRRHDGTTIFVRENAKAIRGDDGSVLFFEGTVEDITERHNAEERILSYQEKLRSLAAELSMTEERERRRIATLLHDNIGQILAVSKIKLGVLQELGGDSGLGGSLVELRSLIEQAIQYTRSLTFELSPPILYELGLEPALEWLGEQVQGQHGVHCSFETDNRPKPLSEELRVFLFTAVRELLVNVVKHAQAARAVVTIQRHDERVVIMVEDSGVGFDSSRMDFQAGRSGGFGLFSIRERLHHLGGDVMVESTMGSGTRVVLTVPVKEEMAARGAG